MNLPTGTVTFLFTDIEGSSALWEQFPEAMKAALARHDALLRQAIESHGGHVVKTTGDGAYAVFASPIGAVLAAIDAQRVLVTIDELRVTSEEASELEARHSQLVTLRVRVGIHTGEAELREGDYHGPTLNRTARIMSSGHGGQILLSAATAALIAGSLPDDISLRDLGEHRLRGISQPIAIYQLAAAGLLQDFPPLQSLTMPIGNLVELLTTFVGREDELGALRHLLGSSRLLTLVGPGGIGKTRLAVRLAREVQQSFEHGVWVIELATISDGEQVAATTAAAIGMREHAGTNPEAQLVDYVNQRRILLVLDNCEHVVGAVARLADTLLRRCPLLTILATSREPLQIAGERLFSVPALSLVGTEYDSLDSLRRSAAVRLFVDRCALNLPGFELTPANAAAIAQIVRRLDGLPLALELAAARIRVLSILDIAERLDDRFRLLTSNNRVSLPRQRTLTALIDWSHDLLSHDERILFRRLAVFPGRWTLEAAEAVVTKREHDDELEPAIAREDLLDLLDGLVNKSLVVVDHDGPGVRYYYLETIRAYASNQLDGAGEREPIMARMLTYIANLAAIAAVHLNGHDQLQWLSKLSAERDNIQSALEWGIRQQPVASVQTMIDLTWFWYMRGVVSRGRNFFDSLDRVVGPLGARLHSDLRAHYLSCYANMIVPLGHAEYAVPMVEFAMAYFHQTGQKGEESNAYILQNVIAGWEGRWSEALRYVERSLKLALEANDPFRIRTARYFLAWLLPRFERYDEAEALHLVTSRANIDAGDLWFESSNLAVFGRLLHLRRRFGEAQVKLDEALIYAKRFNDRHLAGRIYAWLGHTALSCGDTGKARSAAESADQCFIDAGVQTTWPDVPELLGAIEAAEGSPDAAKAHLTRALDICRQMGDSDGAARIQGRLDALDQTELTSKP